MLLKMSNEYHFFIDCARVKKEEINVTHEDGVLRISGRA